MLIQSIHTVKRRLSVWPVALLLAVAAAVAPVVVEEATALSLNPTAHACTSQTGLLEAQENSTRPASETDR